MYRDMLANLGVYAYYPTSDIGNYISTNGAFVGRIFDTFTGGQPERLLVDGAPGDHQCPTRGLLIVRLGPTVGSAMTLIDIDHRSQPGTGSWSELCSVSDTANADGVYICEFQNFKRVIRVTGTITTSDVSIWLVLDRSRRNPMLNPDGEHGGYTELTPTYA